MLFQSKVWLVMICLANDRHNTSNLQMSLDIKKNICRCFFQAQIDYNLFRMFENIFIKLIFEIKVWNTVYCSMCFNNFRTTKEI